MFLQHRERAGALYTFHLSTSWWFDFYSTSSGSSCFKFEYWFINVFIRMERRHYLNLQTVIQTLDEYILGVRCGRGCDFPLEWSLSALRDWVFSPATGPQESKGRLQKPWENWEHHSPDLLNSLPIEKTVTNKNSNRRPPIQTKDFRSRHSS